MPKIHNEVESYVRDKGFDLYIVYGVAGNADGEQEYIMTAFPGAATSAAKWQIFKLSYDANKEIVKKRYANSNDNFDKVADDYADYNYVDI